MGGHIKKIKNTSKIDDCADPWKSHGTTVSINPVTITKYVTGCDCWQYDNDSRYKKSYRRSDKDYSVDKRRVLPIHLNAYDIMKLRKGHNANHL